MWIDPVVYLGNVYFLENLNFNVLHFNGLIIDSMINIRREGGHLIAIRSWIDHHEQGLMNRASLGIFLSIDKMNSNILYTK